jgi:site-specific recombinase XerD
MNVQDVDVTAGLAWIKEKGNIKRIVVLPKILCSTLKPYLEKIHHRSGPLFYQNMENGYHQEHCKISFAMLRTASACGLRDGLRDVP